MIINLKRKLEENQQTKRNLSKHKARLQNRIVQLQGAVEEKNATLKSTDLRGGNKVKLTHEGAYSLVLTRAKANISSNAVVVATGSMSARGRGLKSRGTVQLWEARAVASMRARDADRLMLCQDSVESLVRLGTSDLERLGLERLSHGCVTQSESIAYMGDASNYEAVDNSKVHVSFLWYSNVNLGADAQAVPDTGSLKSKSGKEVVGHDRVSAFVDAMHITEIETIPDLLAVPNGTADELECIIRKEFSCVGIPHVSDRKKQASQHPERHTSYVLSLDAGPDNTCSVKNTIKEIEEIPNVDITTTYCFSHQAHLIAELGLVICDKAEFCVVEEPAPMEEEKEDDDDKGEGGGDAAAAERARVAIPKFSSGLAILANETRRSNVRTKLQAITARQFTETAAEVAWGTQVPKLIKGRWCSAFQVSRHAARGAVHQPPSLIEYFGHPASGEQRQKRRRKSAKRKPDALEELGESQRMALGRWRRQLVLTAMQSPPIFYLKAVVFSTWGQNLDHVQNFIQTMMALVPFPSDRVARSMRGQQPQASL